LGFIRNWIFEAVVSSYRFDRAPHAAPMGLTTYDMERLVMRPYKTSQTYSNLLKWRCGVANMTSDPVIFYITVFKDVNPEGLLPEDWFTPAQAVDAPALRGADINLEFRVIDVRDIDGGRAEFLCVVENIILTGSLAARVYSRAAPAVIESLIHATRIKVFLESGDLEEAEWLMRLVDHYRRLVERVAPDSRYSAIMSDIVRRIESWKSQS